MKEQELKQLQNGDKQQYTKIPAHFGNLSMVDDRNINESMNDMSVIQNKLELDRVFKELENLKIEITNEMRAENMANSTNELDDRIEVKPPIFNTLPEPKEMNSSIKYDRTNRTKKTGSISQIPGMEKQIRQEILHLNDNKRQIIEDLEAFNHEFMGSDLVDDM